MNNNLGIAVLGLGEAGSIFANDLAAMGITVYAWILHQKETFIKVSALQQAIQML